MVESTGTLGLATPGRSDMDANQSLSIATELDGDGKFARVAIAVSPPSAHGATATYRIALRNLCGPTPEVVVNMTRPPASP